MSNQTILYLTFMVLVGIGILLFLNVMSVFSNPTSLNYLALNDIKGSAVEYNGLLYTLNFDQQTKLVEGLNTATSGRTDVKEGIFRSPIRKIIFYRFNAPNLVITSSGYLDNELLFTQAEWNKNSLLQEQTHGAVKQLLAQTYDP